MRSDREGITTTVLFLRYRKCEDTQADSLYNPNNRMYRNLMRIVKALSFIFF